MDFFWNLLDQFQKTALFMELQRFSVLDWIVIVTVLFGMLRGSKEGFSEMFAKALEIALVGVLVLTFYRNVATYIGNAIPMFPDKVLEPVSFILLAFFVWLPLSLCFKVLGKFIRIEVSGPLKFFGGMVCGSAYVFLLLCFISNFLLFFPVEALRKSYDRSHSYTGRALSKTFPKIQEAVMVPFTKKAKGPSAPLAN